MRVCICGPVAIPDLVPWLNGDPGPIRGMGGPSITNLVTSLLHAGADVVVVTLDQSVTEERILSGSQLRIRVGPYRDRHRARDAFRVEREFMVQAIRRERPDLVHAQWTYENALAALASAVPTLITVRDWAPMILRMHTHPYRLVRLGMNLQVLRKGTSFTTVSQPMADRLRRWGVKDPRVIPNAVPDEAFVPRNRTPDPDRPVLVAVNHGFMRWKNTETLMEAFRSIRRSHKGAELHLAGRDFEAGGAANRWAAAHGLADRVHFLGDLDSTTLSALYQQADLLVHPSLEESFGLVIAEAMARGLPVVAGVRSGGVPWVLDGGRAGKLTDVRSAEALAGTVLEVLGDAALWSTLSEHAYRRAWDSFRQTVVTAQYLQAYEAVR